MKAKMVVNIFKISLVAVRSPKLIVVIFIDAPSFQMNSGVG